jgi:hypothetical protein
MTEQRRRTKRQHRCEKVAARGELGVADAVRTGVKRPQPFRVDPMLNCVLAVAKRHELPPRHDTVLQIRERRDRRIQRLSTFTAQRAEFVDS